MRAIMRVIRLALVRHRDNVTRKIAFSFYRSNKSVRLGTFSRGGSGRVNDRETAPRRYPRYCYSLETLYLSRERLEIQCYSMLFLLTL